MDVDLKTPRNIDEENIEKWSDEIEELLSEWAEIGLCYSWLHSYSERKYKTKYHNISIPIIVISTLTGTANFGMDSYIPEKSKSTATLLLEDSTLLVEYLEHYYHFLNMLRYMKTIEYLVLVGLSLLVIYK